MNVFQLEILASDKTFYKGEAEIIIIPSIDGEQGILANHEPMVIAVKSGELRFKVNGEWTRAAAGRGIAQIMKDKVTLLLETAEKPKDIDVRRAEQAKIKAEEQLRQKQSIIQYHESKAALSRAMSRLRAAGKNDSI